jgi:chromosome segregation ATPase
MIDTTTELIARLETAYVERPAQVLLDAVWRLAAQAWEIEKLTTRVKSQSEGYAEWEAWINEDEATQFNAFEPKRHWHLHETILILADERKRAEAAEGEIERQGEDIRRLSGLVNYDEAMHAAIQRAEAAEARARDEEAENISLKIAIEKFEAERDRLRAQSENGQRAVDEAHEILGGSGKIIAALRADLEAARDELEATRWRETRLQTDIAEIGERSRVLETKRNELHSKLEREMLDCDALRAEKAELEAAVRKFRRAALDLNSEAWLALEPLVRDTRFLVESYVPTIKATATEGGR